MRSKRKQVNKYNLKEVQDLKQPNSYDYLRRTSGTKPFQLAKLRQVQRYSVDLAHIKNEILHRRGGSNNLYDDQKQALIIKPKLIVDNNQKLQSQTKDLPIQTSLGNSQILSMDKKSDQFTQIILEQQPFLEQSQLYNNRNVNETHQQSAILQKHQSLYVQNSQLYTFRSPIYSIVTQKHEYNASSKENVLQLNEQQLRSRQEIKLMKQKALPPFSFTSTKWRSKSQILQIDKWKQKYGKQINASQKASNTKKAASLSKLDQNEINKRIDEVKSFIHSIQNQKGSLPNLRKNKQLQSKSKIYRFLSKNKEDIFKIQTNPELQNQHNKYVQQYSRKSREGHKKKKRQQKIQIAIKKMYNHQNPQENTQAPQGEDNSQKKQSKQELSIQQKESKSKKKKLKFPQIQITTFYSTKEEQNEKKRLRLENIHKLAKQWRFHHPPKKVYLRNMMQEIPERWQYGQSRQSKRAEEQVDNYLKNKEQQEMNAIIKRELQQLSINA